MYLQEKCAGTREFKWQQTLLVYLRSDTMTDETKDIELVDDEPDHEEEYSKYQDQVMEVPKQRVVSLMKKMNDDGTMRKIFKARKSSFIGTLIHLNGKKFDFSGRDYLYPIYDARERQVLLKTSRQVEKCCYALSYITLSNGSEKIARNIEVGDVLAGFNAGTLSYETTVVLASESNGTKPVLKIKTMFGCELLVTYNHPLYTKLGWVTADLISNGDYVASIRDTENGFNDFIWDTITSIEPAGEVETWAIQTSNETYISNFIVNHNTTFLANNLLCNSIVIPYNKSLYVSPSHTQTRQFSNEKLRPAIEESPMIKKYFQDSFVSTQVFEKGFTNGSYIFLRSAFRSADRTRGISARDLNIDELQDFLGSEIPVIMECTSHFPDASLLMAGTPKSFDNPIETYWQATTQNEWMVKCRACNFLNCLDEKNIAPTEWYTSGKCLPGPVCCKCMAHLHVAEDGRWMSFSPSQNISGYRIPQLMVPWIISTLDQWVRLLWKRDKYPFGQFANEVLGLSYDNASKPITRQDLISLCNPEEKLLPDFPDANDIARAKKHILIGGIDWGEGNDGSEKSPSGKIRNASYTILTVGTYVSQREFKILYIKKYTGQQVEPDFIMNDVCRLVKLYDIKILGVDWGHGWGVNNTLVRRLGAAKVVQFQYLPKQKEKIKWDPIGYKYQMHRNLIISEMFYDLKNNLVQLPRWSEMEIYCKDILAVFVEYNEYRREMKYDHKPTDPDDFLHSMIYCKRAANIYFGKKI